MQTTLSRCSQQPEPTSPTRLAGSKSDVDRLPLTFHVSRFTPPIHQAVLRPALTRRNDERPEADSPFTLRNTDGFWELTFGDERAVLVQDQALFYVAYLLAHPGQSFQPLELAEKVYELYGAHEDFRQNLPGLETRLLQARNAEVLLLKERNLEAVLDSEDAIEPVKAEALRELASIYALQEAAQNEDAQSMESAGHIILSGLYRLYLSLADGPKTLHPDPHNPIRPFASHLLRRLLIPTIRLSTHGKLQFVYQP